MSGLIITTDDVFEGHRAPGVHPERPERLVAVRERLGAATLPGPSRAGAVRAADEAELVRVHDVDYVRELARATRGRSGWFDADTYFNEHSWDAATCAAGAAIDGTLAVLRGEARAALMLVRPPGHHAEADRAMGFCLLNNVAAAAAAARAEGAERVAIVDWDVHHGNGTQHIFEADPSVMYLSLHQHPFYPGTGAADEIGRDGGQGATINVPLAPGCGDADYAHVMARVVEPALRAFAPDVILVSAGFDAGALDPLAAMRVTEAGFRDLAVRVRGVAEEVAGGRVAAVLEGGYDVNELSGAVVAVAEVLASPWPPANEAAPAPAAPSPRAEAAVFATLRAHRGARNQWLPSDVDGLRP